MTAAFLCGLFYGSLLYAAWLKERDRRRLNRLLRDVHAAIGTAEWDCECGCECGDEPEREVPETVVKEVVSKLHRLQSWSLKGEGYAVFGGIGNGIDCTCDTDSGQCRATFHNLPAEHGACDCKSTRAFHTGSRTND